MARLLSRRSYGLFIALLILASSIGVRAQTGDTTETPTPAPSATPALTPTATGEAADQPTITISSVTLTSDNQLEVQFQQSAADAAGVRVILSDSSGDQRYPPRIYGVAFSPDGKTALNGSEDGRLRLWNVATGEVIRVFSGHTSVVLSVAFSPDGKTALSSSVDDTLRLWDVATGETIRVFSGLTVYAWSVAFSPDGQMALSSSGDGTLGLWDVATGEIIRVFSGQGDSAWSVAFSPDGQTALSSSGDNPLGLWDVATGETVRVFGGNTGIVLSVAFSPDGQTALSGSLDSTLRLWDVTTGEAIRVFSGNTGVARSVAFSPDGQTALSGSSDGTLRLWDVATGETLRVFSGHTDEVWSVAFSPDGQMALSGSWDGTLRLWDVATGETIRIFDANAETWAEALASGQLTIPATGFNTGDYTVQAELLDQTGATLAQTETSTPVQLAPSLSISSAQFSGDSNRIAVALKSSGVSTVRLQVIDPASSAVVSEQTFSTGSSLIGASSGFLLSTNALIPGWTYRIAATNEDGSISAQYDLPVTFSPSPGAWISNVWGRLGGQFIILFSGVLAAVLFVGVRQNQWHQRTRLSRQAILSRQRQQEVEQFKQALPNFTSLYVLYNRVGDMTGVAKRCLERGRFLLEQPDTLTSFSAWASLVSQAMAYTVRGSSALRQYEKAVLDRHNQLIVEEKKAIIDAYWEIDQACRAFPTVFANSPTADQPLADFSEQIGVLWKSVDRVRHQLEPYASLFGEARELETFQHLGELSVTLNRLRQGKIADNLREANQSLEEIGVYVDGLVATFTTTSGAGSPVPMTASVIRRQGIGVDVRDAPLRFLLVRISGAVHSLLEMLGGYSTQVDQGLQNALKSVDSIEQLRDLDSILNGIEGRQFGNHLDMIIDRLLDVTQEVNSAFAQPQGYGRRLTLQEAHIAARDLYALVKNDLPEYATEVQRIASLFEETRRVEEQEGEKTYDNPYVTGNPLLPNRLALFKGRSELAAEMVGRLRGRGSTLLLYGARRMGKSSFLYHLENLLPATYISVLVDCQGATTQNETSFFYQIARSIRDVLRRRDPSTGDKLNRPREEVFKESPASRLEDWLSDEVAPIIGRRQLLIMLDEFEEIGNAIRAGRMSGTILGELRHMIQHSVYMHFMFTGVATLDALVPNAASYFISVSSIELSYLDDPAAEALIRRPYQPDDPTIKVPETAIGQIPEYDDDAVDEIKHLTRNQPFLIQAICEQLIEIANREQLSRITVREVERIASVVEKEYPNYFEFFWNNWGEQGHKLLRAVVNHEPVPTDDTSQQIFLDMLRHRLLDKNADGQYTIEIPLMESFLKKRS